MSQLKFKSMHSSNSRRQRGISLVEMMIGMTLGVIVIMGVMAVMSNNRQNFRVTESMSELQENARMGFELLARDIRAARDTGCGPRVVEIAPLYSASSTVWWHTWNPIRGFNGTTDTNAVTFGNSNAQRVSGTHALQVQGTRDGWPLRNTDPVATTVSTVAGHTFAANNLVIVCDYNGFATRMHRVTGASNNTVTFSSPTDVSNGEIAQYTASTWYIGNNGRTEEGGRALYRMVMNNNGATSPQEVLPGIVAMNLRYRLNGGNDFIDAPTAAQWDTVNAVEITLTAESTQRSVAGDSFGGAFLTADGRLRRTFTHIVTLRN